MNDTDGHFTVWAPLAEEMVLHIVHPCERKIPMERSSDGWFRVHVPGAGAGTRYFYMPDNGAALPDPASHAQPESVSGPSEIIDHNAFEWTDSSWKGIPFNKLILYEVHVGTFSAEGSFEGIIPMLDDIADTGINALQLMPVNQFAGNRNWGYDGVYIYAVQNSYGGPAGLKKLVDACHARNIAVYLDVVYNHLGPEGHVFNKFGPYFTDKYATPWGNAINLDDEFSDPVRDYFSDNALHWFSNYHIDGLRMDAVHFMYDKGAVHIWDYTRRKLDALELKLGRPLYIIAESDTNSPRVTQPAAMGGHCFTAQWLDDFHHALYPLLDPSGVNRYSDFGLMEQLAKAYKDGFVHSGEYVNFRKRRHGASSAGVAGNQFIVFTNNHDQCGNRPGGERMSLLVNFERQQIAAAAMFLSPYIPMLFMGDEYAEDQPFFYFSGYADPGMQQAIREGRKKEFEKFNGENEMPDPFADDTLERSKLQWHKRNNGQYKEMLEWHKKLIALRQTNPALQSFGKNDTEAYPVGQQAFILYRKSICKKHQLIALFNISDRAINTNTPGMHAAWKLLLQSGQGAPATTKPGEAITLAPLSVWIYEDSN